MNLKETMELATRIGFDAVFPLDPKSIEFRQDVRDMCAQCRNYGKSWGCPPSCESVESITEACKPFTEGILMQTIAKKSRTIMDDAKKHGALFSVFCDELRTKNSQFIPMGAGGCRRCEKCNYPDEPCAHPELVFPSMEASGILILDLCKANQIPYYYGEGTVAFMACCLINPTNPTE